VFSFLKDKKLTGDQSPEIVRKIKGELVFTFKDASLTGMVKKSKASSIYNHYSSESNGTQYKLRYQ